MGISRSQVELRKWIGVRPCLGDPRYNEDAWESDSPMRRFGQLLAGPPASKGVSGHLMPSHHGISGYLTQGVLRHLGASQGNRS